MRPTGDRIRETLFNWLAPDIVGARCLDLFAGTGSLGLECLSRGAARAWLLEKHVGAATALAGNLERLEAGRGHLINTNSIDWLLTRATDIISAKSIGIVFLDPPFEEQLWEPAIAALEVADLLTGGAKIYIETPRRQAVAMSSRYQLLREKTAGHVCYRLYHKKL